MTTQANPSVNPQTGDEIDLRMIFAALWRRKALIAKITATSVLLSGLYSLTKQPVWEGQFEIVLAGAQSTQSQTSSLIQSNPGISKLIGARSGNNQLKTEIEILESPSVLKPVFDFVKEKKQQQGINTQKWRYADWLDNLTIELVRDTSVLELSYRDTDKDLVLPVIQKISKTYQEYSGRDRERGINQAIQYLDQQIEIYRKKSIRSLRAVQEYAIEQDLTVLRGDGASDTRTQNSLDIESIRIESSNQIRNINEQLKQLDQHGNNPETLMHFGRTIPELSSLGISQKLDEMDTDLALLRAKFTDQDDSIRRLTNVRRQHIEIFKRQIYGYLYAQRVAAKARLKSAERPKGVLIKFRELLRAAARDEETLTRLEYDRQLSGLEKARKEDPWELISNPTLLDKPVAPSIKSTITLGLLAGLVIGSGAALFVDRRTGLVYSENELKSLLPCPLIDHLPAMGGSAFADAADLLAAGPLAKAPDNSAIALIPIGNIPAEQLNAFSAELSRAIQTHELLISTDLRQTSRCTTQLLVTSKGVATRNELSQLRQKLALQGTPLAGWVLLDPELNLG